MAKIDDEIKDKDSCADSTMQDASKEQASAVENAETAETQVERADVDENEDASDASKTAETANADAAENTGANSANGKKDSKDVVIEQLQDQVKRQMAEFDNFRKRTEKEKSAMFEMGASDIIKKLLPIVDNFERGFKTVSEEDKDDAFVKGMDMVYKQMVKMLEDSEVKSIEAVGVEFNPELHNAVMHVEDDSVGDNIIVEEFEKGYIYRETVIRHSMVKVAN